MIQILINSIISKKKKKERNHTAALLVLFSLNGTMFAFLIWCVSRGRSAPRSQCGGAAGVSPLFATLLLLTKTSGSVFRNVGSCCPYWSVCVIVCFLLFFLMLILDSNWSVRPPYFWLLHSVPADHWLWIILLHFKTKNICDDVMLLWRRLDFVGSRVQMHQCWELNPVQVSHGAGPRSGSQSWPVESYTGVSWVWTCCGCGTVGLLKVSGADFLFIMNDIFYLFFKN